MAATTEPRLPRLRREVSALRQDAVQALRALRRRDDSAPSSAATQIDQLRLRLQRCKDALVMLDGDTVAWAAAIGDDRPARRRANTERAFRSKVLRRNRARTHTTAAGSDTPAAWSVAGEGLRGRVEARPPNRTYAAWYRTFNQRLANGACSE